MNFPPCIIRGVNSLFREFVMSFIIDKISLTFKSHDYYNRVGLDSYKAVDIRKFFDKCDYQMRETGKINTYRDMVWGHVNEEGVVAVKYGRFNKEGGINYGFINIEYNPSKCVLPTVIIDFLIAFNFKVYEITSIDLAFDIPNITVNDVLLTGHASSQIMTFGTLGATSTKYLHPKVNHGRIKIYDKYAERLQASRKIPSIDPELYKGITRCEITFHNVYFLLEPFYNNGEVIRINELFKFVSQVMYKGNKSGLLDETISEIDRFCIDNFVEVGRTDLAQAYIRNKGVNQRQKLLKYLKFEHYRPLWYNDLSSQIRFAELTRDKIKALLPSQLFVS